jgi:1,4-dihydroxy-2-naphthoate octaprenyltransferase
MRMSLISFLKLVEIRTKVASMIPFLIGTVYAIYRFGEFRLYPFILMFISLICVDMAVTAINNYYDFKKARKTVGYGYENHNAVVKYQLKEMTVIFIILTLLLIAITTGILLVMEAGIVVLFLGGISFTLGILYSFGPVPISRLPLGELISGFFMGFVLIFVSVYIHVDQQDIAQMVFSKGLTEFSLVIDVVEVIYIFLFSIPIILSIANIMLANNICDIEDDWDNRRFTLPVFIGKDMALLGYRLFYYVAYLDLLFLLVLQVPVYMVAILLLTFLPVNRNINRFLKVQSKEHTFALAVQNFVVISVSLLITIGLACIL